MFLQIITTVLCLLLLLKKNARTIYAEKQHRFMITHTQKQEILTKFFSFVISWSTSIPIIFSHLYITARCNYERLAFFIDRSVSFRQAQSGWRLHWWMALEKLWWEFGGHTRPWMNLTRQRAPQKPLTVSASFAPHPRSTLCECRCARGCRCVPSRPTPYQRTQHGKAWRSNRNPAQFGKCPAALATQSLKCIR